MASDTAVDPKPPTHSPFVSSGAGKWTALTAALLGWMFDGVEIGMWPVVGKPALIEMIGSAPELKTTVNQWFGAIVAIFLVGAASGGVLFGWLGDRIGRVRAMTLSILTYAIFTGLCGLVTQPWQLALLRFIAALGMGGEWALGVALVTEVWPNNSRTFLAGLIGAAANAGMLLVPLLSLGVITAGTALNGTMVSIGMPQAWADALLAHSAWRLLLISGAAPAVLTLFTILFVPESEKWKHERDRGSTTHMSSIDLFGTVIGTLGALAIVVLWSPLVDNTALRIVGTLIGLTVTLIGFIYPIRMYLRRSLAAGSMAAGSDRPIIKRLLLGAGLSGVALLGTWGLVQWAAKWASELADPKLFPSAVQHTQIVNSFGAIVGTILAALAAGKFGRRATYCALCFGSLLSLLFLFQFNSAYGTQFLVSVFFAGGISAAFYGFFPLYLPELFPTSIRSTSQGFAYNFGRVIAAIGTLQTAQVEAFFGGSFAKAGSALAFIYLIGAAIIWIGPETKGKPLPE